MGAITHNLPDHNIAPFSDKQKHHLETKPEVLKSGSTSHFKTFEITDLSLMDMLSLVHLSHDDNGSQSTELFTIHGVNHHYVDTSSKEYQGLKLKLESDDNLDFFDLHFGGVLYDVMNRTGEGGSLPLTKMTGGGTLDEMTFSIRQSPPTEGLSTYLHSLRSGHLQDNLLQDIMAMQTKHDLRLALLEGIHRIYAIYQCLQTVSTQDGSSPLYQKLKELLMRKVRLVVYCPTQELTHHLKSFINNCYQESKNISTNRTFVTKHTYLDKIKNCYQQYLIRLKSNDKNILSSNFFGDAKNRINVDSLSIADDIFSWLLDQENYTWEKANDGTDEKPIILNSFSGLGMVGNLQVVNAVTKSADPWRISNIYFEDKKNKRICMVQHGDMCLYSLLIVICFSDKSHDIVQKVLSHVPPILTEKRTCKCI